MGTAIDVGDAATSIASARSDAHAALDQARGGDQSIANTLAAIPDAKAHAPEPYQGRPARSPLMPPSDAVTQAPGDGADLQIPDDSSGPKPPAPDVTPYEDNGEYSLASLNHFRRDAFKGTWEEIKDVAPRVLWKWGDFITKGAAGAAYINDTVGNALTGSDNHLADKIFKFRDDYIAPKIKAWTPERADTTGQGPGTGPAAQAIGNAAEIIPALFAGPEAVVPMIASAATQSPYDAIDKGESVESASAQGIVDGLASLVQLKFGVMPKLPVLWRMAHAIGAGDLANVLDGYAKKLILHESGRDDQANAIDPFAGLGEQTLMNAVFGLHGGEKKAKDKTPPPPPAATTTPPPGADAIAPDGTPTPPPASAVPAPTPGDSGFKIPVPATMPEGLPQDNTAGPPPPPSGTPVASPVPDIPSAESAQSLRAQFKDLKDSDTPRTGLLVSMDSIASMRGGKDVNQLAVMGNLNNAHTQGRTITLPQGVLVLATKKGAQAAQARLDAGEDPQSVIGSVTGSGGGKAPDQTAVVQGKDAAGNIAVEKMVTPQDVPMATQAMLDEGKAPVVTTPAESVAQRTNDISKERNTPTQMGIMTTPSGHQVAVHVEPGAEKGFMRVRPLDQDGEPANHALDVPADRVKVAPVPEPKPAPPKDSVTAVEAIAPEPAPKETQRPATPTESASPSAPARDEGASPSPQENQLPEDLAKSSPKYSYGSKQFALNFHDDRDLAAYVIGGSGMSKSHGKFLAWAQKVTGKSEAELIAAGRKIRDDIKTQASGDAKDKITVKPSGYWDAAEAAEKLPKDLAKSSDTAPEKPLPYTPNESGKGEAAAKRRAENAASRKVVEGIVEKAKAGKPVVDDAAVKADMDKVNEIIDSHDMSVDGDAAYQKVREIVGDNMPSKRKLFPDGVDEHDDPETAMHDAAIAALKDKHTSAPKSADAAAGEKPVPKQSAEIKKAKKPEDAFEKLREQLATHEAQEAGDGNRDSKFPAKLKERRDHTLSMAVALSDAAKKAAGKASPTAIERAAKAAKLVFSVKEGTDKKAATTAASGVGVKDDETTAKGQGITHPILDIINDEMHRAARGLLGIEKPGDEVSLMTGKNNDSIKEAVTKAKVAANRAKKSTKVVVPGEEAPTDAQVKAVKAQLAKDKAAAKKAKDEAKAKADAEMVEVPVNPKYAADIKQKPEPEKTISPEIVKKTRQLSEKFIWSEDGDDHQAAKAEMEQHLHEAFPNESLEFRESAMRDLVERRAEENPDSARPTRMSETVEDAESILDEKAMLKGGDMRRVDVKSFRSLIEAQAKKLAAIKERVFSNKMMQQWRRLGGRVDMENLLGAIGSGKANSTHEVLDHLISKLGNDTPQLKGILQKLRELAPDVPIYSVATVKSVSGAGRGKKVAGANGLYDGNSKTIQVKGGRATQTLITTVHEIFHAATVHELVDNPTGNLARHLQQALDVLNARVAARYADQYGLDWIKQHNDFHNGEGPIPKDYQRTFYGLSHTHEMISELFTNPDFAQLIAESEKWAQPNENLSHFGVSGYGDSLLGRIMARVGQFFGISDPKLLRHITGLSEVTMEKQNQGMRIKGPHESMMGTAAQYHEANYFNILKGIGLSPLQGNKGEYRSPGEGRIYNVGYEPKNILDLRDPAHQQAYMQARDRYNAAATDPDDHLPRLQTPGFIANAGNFRDIPAPGSVRDLMNRGANVLEAVKAAPGIRKLYEPVELDPKIADVAGENPDLVRRSVGHPDEDETPITYQTAKYKRAASESLSAVRTAVDDVKSVDQVIRDRRSDFGNPDDPHNPLNKFEDVDIAKNKKQQALHAITRPVAEAWSKLSDDVNKTLGGLIKDVTMWHLDPRQEFDEHSPAVRDQYDAEAKHADFVKRLAELPADARHVFGAQFDANRILLKEQRKAGIDAALRTFSDSSVISDAHKRLLYSAQGPEHLDALVGYGRLVDVGEHNAELRGALDSFAGQEEIHGPYAHLGRDGKFVVTATPNGEKEFPSQAAAEKFTDFVNKLSPNSKATYKMRGDEHVVKYKADYTSFHHSEFEAERHAAYMEKTGLDIGRVTQKTDSDNDAGLSHDAMKLIAAAKRKIMKNTDKNDPNSSKGEQALVQALHSAMLQAAASRSSYAGSKLARKAAEGVKPEEMRRNFADYAQSAAWHISQLGSIYDQANALSALQSAARERSLSIPQATTYRRGQTVSILGKHMLFDATNFGTKTPFNAGLSKLGFLSYLGSPSHAIIWSTQNFTTGIPVAAARWGLKDSAQAFGKAMWVVGSPVMRTAWNTAMRGVGNTLQAIGSRLQGTGTSQNIYNQMRGSFATAHDIHNAIVAVLAKHPDYAKYVTGENSAFQQLLDRGAMNHGYADAMNELAQQGSSTGLSDIKPINLVFEMARILPNMADAVNRVSTALAGLELTQGDVRKTSDFVREIHADYSAQNKPLAFKGLNKYVGGNSITMYKTYTQSMAHLLYGNVKSAIVGSTKLAMGSDEAGLKTKTAVAAKTVAGMIVGNALFAGVYGAAILEPIRLAIWAYHKLFDDEGEINDLKNSTNRWVEDAAQSAGLSQETGRDIAGGIIPRSMGMDLSSRMGLADLFFHDMPDLLSNSDDNWKQFIYNESGTMTSFLASNATRAHQHIQNGEYGQALSSLVPIKAYQDAVKAHDLYTTGKQNSIGSTMTPPSGWDALKQAVGIKPASVADSQEHARVSADYRGTLKATKADILKALVSNKPGAQDRMIAFNKMHPAEQITSKNIGSLQQLQQNIQNNAPSRDPDLNARENF
jgi:hypothetical protein